LGLKYCMGCSLVDVCIIAKDDLFVNEEFGMYLNKVHQRHNM
jgi:hypothetical protein